jgi:tetratricopeptide (TPR) repeat protein
MIAAACLALAAGTTVVAPRAVAAEEVPAQAEAPIHGALSALHSATSAGDPKAILGARAALAGMLADSPKDAALHYWAAYADWRAVPLLMRDNKKAAERQCEAGLAAAEKAMALDPTNAEVVALHAGLQGLSLGFKNPMAGMTLGPKMEESMKKARTLAPGNPRVMLFEGINTFHKPGFVGGGADKAMPIFERAREAFEAEAVTPEHWGHDDVYVWLGRASMEEKDYAAARTYLRKALEVNPDHGWAGKVLLPKVEAELAKRAG